MVSAIICLWGGGGEGVAFRNPRGQVIYLKRGGGCCIQKYIRGEEEGREWCSATLGDRLYNQKGVYINPPFLSPL